jgi:hypothetical protein
VAKREHNIKTALQEYCRWQKIPIKFEGNSIIVNPKDPVYKIPDIYLYTFAEIIGLLDPIETYLRTGDLMPYYVKSFIKRKSETE